MEEKLSQNLVFVYNAISGMGNAVMDSMHKVFSPKTYACSLCAITYGAVSEKGTWKRFRKESPHQMTFLHKDEFEEVYASKFGYKFTFPIVLAEGKNGLEVLISAEELNTLKTPEDLIELVNKRSIV